MHPIFLKVQDYLSRSNNEAVGMPKDVVVQFARDCAQALNRHFNTKPGGKFTLRMSNVGRPLCQLQMEKAGAPSEAPGYSHKMMMLTGDLLEAAAVAIMRGAGVNIEEVQKRVALPVASTNISGTLDLKIDGKVWDVKTASPYAFNNKFAPGYSAVKREDAYGYVAQGYGYGEADQAPFGGWIVINKATGEWSVVEAPESLSEKTEALAKIEDNVKAINEGKPFERCYADEPELFRKKPTGNRVLGTVCSFCPFKWECWPGLQYKPSVIGESKNPQHKYYTSIQNDPKEGVT